MLKITKANQNCMMNLKQYIEKSTAFNVYERKRMAENWWIDNLLRKLEKDEKNKAKEKMRKDNIINEIKKEKYSKKWKTPKVANI